MEHLGDNINELEINLKDKNIMNLYGGVNELKEGYQSWINLVKYQKGNLHADSHIVLNRWKNYFFKSLNVFLCNDINHTKIHRAVPLVRLTLRWLLKS